MTDAGLLDTSVFIASESGRALQSDLLPADSYVSVITLAELQVGIHAAEDTDTRARRLRTFEVASLVEALAVSPDAAAEWARMRFRLREEGLRANVNDLWIAAVALAHNLPVITQDGDFEALVPVGGPAVIRI